MDSTPRRSAVLASALESDIDRALASLRNDQDKYLLDFFGDLESAKKYAKYFVFEEEKEEIHTDDKSANGTLYKILYVYRLRPKTVKELEEERLNG